MNDLLAPSWRETAALYLLKGFAALSAIIAHEVSHGLAANALGDDTAREQGRLTLNPFKHIDLFGLLMLIVVGFGWARPVPVDIRSFKKPRRDLCLVALAGPGMNFLMALLSFFTLGFLYLLPAAPRMVSLFCDFLWMFATINVGLGVFNLFPIPPLDGSKALGMVLPDRIYYRVLSYERYGMGILMLLLLLGVLNKPLAFLRDTALGWLITAGFWPASLIGG